MSTNPGFRHYQVPQSCPGSFGEQADVAQYRMNQLAVTRPGGCKDAGHLHCSTGVSRKTTAQMLNEPMHERSPGDCAIERSRQAKFHDSWGEGIQHYKSSLKEVDMTRYLVAPTSVPDGYKGIDVTLHQNSRLSSIAASQGNCGSQQRYRSYGKYA